MVDNLDTFVDSFTAAELVVERVGAEDSLGIVNVARAAVLLDLHREVVGHC